MLVVGSVNLIKKSLRLVYPSWLLLLGRNSEVVISAGEILSLSLSTPLLPPDPIRSDVDPRFK